MPRRDAPRDSDSAGPRPKGSDAPSGRHPSGDDWLKKAGDDTGELEVGPPIDDEPSTTVGPLPVRARAAAPRPEPTDSQLEREASRRQISSVAGAAPLRDSTRAEVNPLLTTKPARPSRPSGEPDPQTKPELSREVQRARDSLLEVRDSEDEPATSVNALPFKRGGERSGGETLAKDAKPQEGDPAPARPPLAPRSSTKGEVPLAETTGASGAPRRGTRGAIPAALAPADPEPALKKGAPTARSSTRGEVPVARPPGPANGPSSMLRGDAGDKPAAAPGLARPPSSSGAPSASPSKPPPQATRIEDEITGPENIPRPRVSPAEAVEDRTGPVDKPKRPVTPRREGAVRLEDRTTPPPIETTARPEPRPEPVPDPRRDGRPMLSEQKTGQFRADALEPAPAPPAAVAKKSATPPKPAKSGGALGSLKKLAQTGMHLLPGKGEGIKDFIQRTGMMRLSQIQSLTGLHRLGPSRLGFQVAIAGVMLLLGFGLVVHVVFGKDLPPEETLQYLYPYGFTGGVQPNGRMAPPASAVHFTFTGTVDCGSGVCDHFTVDGADSSFHIEMTVTKRDDGNWTLVGGPPVR